MKKEEEGRGAAQVTSGGVDGKNEEVQRRSKKEHPRSIQLTPVQLSAGWMVAGLTLPTTDQSGCDVWCSKRAL